MDDRERLALARECLRFCLERYGPDTPDPNDRLRLIAWHKRWQHVFPDAEALWGAVRKVLAADQP